VLDRPKELAIDVEKAVKASPNYLDKYKLKAAFFEGDIAGTVLLSDGSFSSFRIIDAEINQRRYSGEVKIAFLSGDVQIGTFNNQVSPFFLKDGTKVDTIIVDRAISRLILQNGQNIPVKILQGKIAGGKLSGVFSAQTFNSGHIIVGQADGNGMLIAVQVAQGAEKATEAQTFVAQQALNLYKRIAQETSSRALGARQEVLGVSDLSSIEFAGIEGIPSPIYDDKRGTWNFGVLLAPSTSQISNIITYFNQTLPSVIQNQVETQVTEKVIKEAIVVADTDISEIKSDSARLKITTEDTVSTLSLDLAGITTDISKDSVKTDHIKDGEVKEGDLADGAVSEDKLANTLVFDNGDFLNLSAITHNSSSNQGLLLPNASSASPVSPSSGEGYIAWDTSGDQLVVYDGSSWTTVAGDGGSGDITGVTAGTGLFGGGDSGAVTISIDYTNSKIVRSDQTESITGAWTFYTDTTLTLAETEDLILNLSVSGTNSGQAETITLTNSSTSGNQYGLYIDNAASTGTTDALIYLDNSDTDNVVKSAIQVANSARFTNVFDIGGTGLSASEIILLDSGIALSELTDSGTLTATTVDINGGAIDGVTIGGASSGAGAFTTLVANTLDTAGTITAGSGNEVITLSTGKIDADALTLAAAADGGTGISSGSGLEARSDGIGLLQGCTDGQVLKWVESTDTWDCAADSTGGGGGFPTETLTGDLESLSSSAYTTIFTIPLTTNTTNVIYAILAQSTSATTVGIQTRGRVTQSVYTGYCSFVRQSSATANANTDNIAVSTNPADTAQTAERATAATRTEVTCTVTTNETAGDLVLEFQSETGSSVKTLAGSWYQKVAGADLAEIYYTKDGTIRSGDVVSLDSTISGGVRKSGKAYDRETIGIITTEPGLVTGDGKTNTKDIPVLVALSGRVPVKVTAENGPIKPGDLLTSSSTPGVAMRATKAGQIVGQAMTPFDRGGIGSVLAFIKTIYANGSKIADLLPGLSASTSEMEAQNTSEVSLSKLALTQFISQKEQLAQQVDLSEIVTDRIAAGLEVITPKVTAQELNVDTIAAATGSEVVLNLTNDGQFVFKDESGEEAISFDSLGNAFFRGTVNADKVKANQIEGLEVITNQISKIKDQNDNLNVKTEELAGQIAGVATFGGKTIFQALTDFIGNVIFNGDVTFLGRPTFNKDTAGFALIKKDSDKVDISFEKEYANIPIVNISATLDFDGSQATPEQKATQEALESKILNGDIRYLVTNRTTKGFTIKLNKPAHEDLTFSWVALVVQDAKTTVSNKPVAIDEVSASEPSPSPSPSLSPQPEADQPLAETPIVSAPPEASVSATTQ
ncbi:hypothetical protein HY405_01825, partial [Candidatus Microgenomates bacterium]|nr:hypothetical protein [Candidatus Microgenomates bacterium]